MTTVKLYAGLGNQLFQYAYGLALRARGERVRFVLSPGGGAISDVFDLRDPNLLLLANPLSALLVKAWARYVERSYQVGFFQSFEHADIARESGRFEFRGAVDFESSELAELAEGPATVSVHVRGGDYLRAGIADIYGSVCGKAYYERAFEAIRASVEEPRFLVLSDDVEHAKRMLDGLDGQFTIARDDRFREDPGFDLWLMSRCRHHIIANSTFSWWGAFLGSGAGRLCACPDRWTSDDRVDLSALIPPNWIRIPTQAAAT